MSLLLSNARVLNAGALLAPAGTGLVIESLTSTFADSAFGQQGRIGKAARWRSSAAQTYLEWGLTPATTLVASWALERVSQARRSPVSGLTPLAFGFRQKLWSDDAQTLSYQVSGLLPALSSAEARAIGAGIGPGAEAMLQYFRNLRVLAEDAFVELRSGWRLIGLGGVNEFLLEGGLGLRLPPRWLLMLQSFGGVAFSPGRRADSCERPAYEKLEASATYDIDSHWSIEAGVSMTAFGRATLRDRGFSLAVERRF